MATIILYIALFVYLVILSLHLYHVRKGMVIVRCGWFPPNGYKAIMLLWWLVVRKGSVVTRKLLRHESIHMRQQGEMLLLPFFLWYGVEYLFRLWQYRDTRLAYRNISFEREAYANEKEEDYLNSRKLFAWVGYLHQPTIV